MRTEKRGCGLWFALVCLLGLALSGIAIAHDLRSAKSAEPPDYGMERYSGEVGPDPFYATPEHPPEWYNEAASKQTPAPLPAFRVGPYTDQFGRVVMVQVEAVTEYSRDNHGNEWFTIGAHKYYRTNSGILYLTEGSVYP
jgi:hypothetical protein